MCTHKVISLKTASIKSKKVLCRNLAGYVEKQYSCDPNLLWDLYYLKLYVTFRSPRECRNINNIVGENTL